MTYSDTAKSLESFLQGYYKDTDVKFIDILNATDEDLAPYMDGLALLDEGKVTLPLIFIDGKPAFYGGISNTAILNYIKEAKHE